MQVLQRHLTEIGPPDLGSLLQANGILLLRGLRDADDLRAAASSLGSPILPGVGIPSEALDATDVYEVKRRGSGLRDNCHNLITSTTAAHFPLHTDGYNLARPPRYVLLLRIDTSAETVISVVSDARAAAKRLASSSRSRLRHAAFPSARGPVALVEREGRLQRVRFNMEEAERWHTDEDLSAVRQLSSQMGAIAARLALARGECLLLDNWRMCHGREALAANSRRVLLRMWIDAPAVRG